MDDISTASTASASTGAGISDAPASASSPDTSTAAVSTTPAAPEASPAASSQSVTTPAPAEPSIDAGWNLEDETDSAAQLVPDNDDDLETLTTEPGLEPTKVPGLVQAIKDARAAVKTYSTETRTLREENARLQATLDQVGGESGAKTWQQLLQAPQSEHGANPFLDDLHARAYPAFERLLKDAVLGTPELAIETLQAAGLLPEIPAEPAAGSIFTADTLASIPAHLQEIAKSLPPYVQEDLLQQPEEARNFNLERELKLSQLDATQRQQAQQQYQQQYSQAQQQGQQAVIELHQQYEQANFQILSKWQAHGPENAAANQRLHREVMEGAMAELLSDKQYAQMYQDSQALLAQAPLRRLQRDAMAAEQDERQARQMAARVNTRLGQLIRQRVQEREAVYSKARQWDEYQRSQIQPRTEVSGASSQAASSNGISRLDEKGRLSSAYLEDVSRRYGSQRST
jgi:hypothetical protein